MYAQHVHRGYHISPFFLIAFPVCEEGLPAFTSLNVKKSGNLALFVTYFVQNIHSISMLE
jgi:hypothetical protein